MKLISFRHQDRGSYGIVFGAGIIDAGRSACCSTIRDLHASQNAKPLIDLRTSNP